MTPDFTCKIKAIAIAHVKRAKKVNVKNILEAK